MTKLTGLFCAVARDKEHQQELIDDMVVRIDKGNKIDALYDELKELQQGGLVKNMKEIQRVQIAIKEII